MAEMLSGISEALGDTIIDGIQAILYATVYKLLYYLAVGCCWIVDLLYSMFEVMAGLSKVSYDGDYDYLINIFFSNSTVSKIYWGMALIGLTVGFAFAIAAVIKKLFDLSEKEKRSYGQILRGLFKSALTILCMSLIITMVLNATTLLMQQVNYVFINADALGEEKSIEYTDEEYAAMARVLNTVGNFSLNPSYNNRYNLNKCFNEIRPDLQYLKSQGVFDFHYVTKDMEGNTVATWQSALQSIANSASLDRDLSLDVYHESVSNSILKAMELLKINGSFKPLETYKRQYQPSRSSVPMDRLLFLMASMRAAKNSDYNVNPSLTDPLRGAYYYGEKSIYDLDSVNEDFDIGIAAIDYVVLFLAAYKLLEILATVILNCVGRIFNMLLLYLISPLVVSVSPLDDGAKFKQWTTAFVVQSLSVFGTVISMRVLLLFMPMVTDSKLVLFSNPIGNLLAKLVVILGACEVAEKATSLITGILADNAGWQSITAGDMSGVAKGMVAKGQQKAIGAAMGVGGMGLSAVGLGGKVGLKTLAGAGLAAGYGVYGAGKLTAGGVKALSNKISAWRNSGASANGGGEGASAAPTGEQTPSVPTNQHDTSEQPPPAGGVGTGAGLNGPLDSYVSQPPAGGTGNGPAPTNQHDAPVQQPPAGGTGNGPAPTNQHDAPVQQPPAGGTGNGPAPTNLHDAPVQQPPAGGTGNGPAPTNLHDAPVQQPPAGGTGNGPAPTNQHDAYAPQTQTGFEGYGSAPVGQQSSRIAAMARAVDAHNLGQDSAPAGQQSSRIAAMADAFAVHNMNPNQRNVDPYAVGQAAAQRQGPTKQVPRSVRNQQNNT